MNIIEKIMVIVFVSLGALLLFEAALFLFLMVHFS